LKFFHNSDKINQCNQLIQYLQYLRYMPNDTYVIQLINSSSRKIVTKDQSAFAIRGNLDRLSHRARNKMISELIGSLPQVLSVKAHSIVLQIALIVTWSNSMAKQLAKFLLRGVTYRKSSIRPCMKLWKLLCFVIEVSASSLMLPNT